MNILFAVTGLVPHVITQAMWCFHMQRSIQFQRVHILTTSKGKSVLYEGDSKRQFDPFLGPNGALNRFISEFSIESPTIEVSTITGSDNVEIDDVKTEKEFETAAYAILDGIRNTKMGDRDQMMCIYSGGRRAMASYLLSALSLVAKRNQRLFYVHHSPQDVDRVPSFYYKPKLSTVLQIQDRTIESADVDLSLHEIAFPRLGEKYSGVITDDHSYPEIVEHVQSYISNEPRPVVTLEDNDGAEPSIIGESEALKATLRRLKEFAKVGLNPVLLCGETGTGKELLANYYHYWHDTFSGKKSRLIVINCGAIPQELAESELFGAKKGSHSTATKDMPGRLSAADKGVLFLDEIEAISSSIQVKLLRFLQFGEIQPLGGTDIDGGKKIEAKVVLAVNEEIKALVKRGLMRPDFFYRITKGRIDIPPLRERKSDIPLLITHFIDEASAQFGKSRVTITPEIVHQLVNFDWPGNIRELGNFVERLVVLANTPTIASLDEAPTVLSLTKMATSVDEESVLSTIVGPNYRSSSFNDRTRAFEKWLLSIEYERHGRNAVTTAKAIGLPPSTLKDKLKELGIT